MIRCLLVSIPLIALTAATSTAVAQRTPTIPRHITRTEAIQLAVGFSPRAAAIASDTLVARAQLRAARAYPNPTITAEYSKAAPQHHLILELPLELPALRRARVRAAAATHRSAQSAFLADSAAIALDVDTLYSDAQGALLRLDASGAIAQDAQRLLAFTEERRTAGDASDLDVELVRANAEQLAGVAAADSANSTDVLLEWQNAMGVAGDSIVYLPIIPGALSSLPLDTARRPLVAPRIAAARAALEAAQHTVALQHVLAFGTPALDLGVEGRDPTGAERGALPLVGISLPLPLFNRNGGAIAAARADVGRARAELSLATLEAQSRLDRAVRARAAAQQRLARDSVALASTAHAARLSQIAYREGEMTVSDVLQAQRSYRELQEQVQNDFVTVLVSDAVVRVYTGQPLIQP